MSEVRRAVDEVDRQIVSLLIERFDYMKAAARIKTDRSAVRDDVRKAEVIENARSAARDAGIPDTAIAEMWETLVEASIAFELETWDRLRP